MSKNKTTFFGIVIKSSDEYKLNKLIDWIAFNTMTKEERTQKMKEICIENNIDFEDVEDI